MIYPQERNIHRPIHLYNNGEFYLVTGITYERIDHFVDDRKEILRSCLIKAIKIYHPAVYAWVIVNNHYHLLLSFDNSDTAGGNVECNELVSAGCDELRPSVSEGEIRYRQRPKEVGDDNKSRPWHSPGPQFVRPRVGTSGHNQFSKFIQYIHSNSAVLVNRLDNQKGRIVWHQYWDTNVREESDFYTCFNYIHLNPIKHRLVRNREELANYKFCSYKDQLDKLGEEAINEIIACYPVKSLSKLED